MRALPPFGQGREVEGEMDLGNFGVPTLLSPVTPLTHKRVVEAATNLFLFRPINTVSVDRIAREAKVSRRTLYDIRASRDELVRWIFEPLLEAAVSHLPSPPSPEITLDDAIREHVANVLDMLRSEPHRRLLAAIRLNREDHPWLDEAYEQRIRRPLFGMFKESILDKCAADALELASSNPVVQRLHSVLEAYASGEREPGSASDAADGYADAAMQEFASWFIRGHFSRGLGLHQRPEQRTARQTGLY